METESKPQNLSFEDFSKFDIRTGTIVSFEMVPKSKKLVKLEVYFGPEIGTKTILSGIGPFHSSPLDEVAESSTYLTEGQFVIAVLNLAPRTMMGITSYGMLLAAKDATNKIWLASCPAVPPGSSVG